MLAADAQLNFVAVLIGVGVDVLCTTLAGFLLFAHFGVDPADPAALERLTESRSFLLVNLLLGLLFTAFGAYVAAAFARGSELNHAAAVGLVSTALSLVSSIFVRAPLWYLALIVALTVPGALVGGYLGLLTLP